MPEVDMPTNTVLNEIAHLGFTDWKVSERRGQTVFEQNGLFNSEFR